MPVVSTACLHDLFATSRAAHPTRVAVDVPPAAGRPRRTCTYADLDGDAAGLAAALAGCVAPGDLVAILVSRDDPRWIAAQIAVLRRGAAFVCPDPSLPPAGLAFVLDDAGVAAAVADSAGRERLAHAGRAGLATVAVDGVAEDAAAPPNANDCGPAETAAYVIYTSGTTGRPKGVRVGHASVVQLITTGVAYFDYRPTDRIAQGSSGAFDSSIEEVWSALAVGAAVVVIDDETIRLGPDLVPWLRRERITVLMPTPTLLRTLGVADPAGELPDLRLVYAGGEAMPRALCDRWAGAVRLENGYGPTECTVTVTRGRLHPGAAITIGRPLPGNDALILDAALQPVPDGESGELCIRGPSLALGYLRRPELDAERFPVHPIHGRIYRTGDLVQRVADGDLAYLGRIDAQVKLRGYRIELEEIEARLERLPGVGGAACRVDGDGATARLIGFVVPVDPGAEPDFSALAERLRAELPERMVPTAWRAIAALPRTTSGKLDRRALPAIVPDADRAVAAPLPADPLLARVLDSLRVHLAAPALGPDDDLFAVGGADSVRVAEWISRCRPDPATGALAVRDVYEAPTARGLAARACAARGPAPVGGSGDGATTAAGDPTAATLVQTSLLALVLAGGGAVAWLLAFAVLPWLVASLGLIGIVLLLPLAGFALQLALLPVTIAVAVAAKWTLIGRYRAGEYPAWSAFHVRHWIVQRAVRWIPWGLLGGTVFQPALLRLLGARIGARCHVHRGVDLLGGGWDLLTIGDDVTLGQDATLGLIEWDAGALRVAPVTLGDGVTLETRAGVRGGTTLDAGASLAPLASLERGDRVPAHRRFAGVPARDVGLTPAPPTLTTGGWHPIAHGLLLVAARGLVDLAAGLPGAVAVLGVLLGFGVDGDAALAWLFAPGASPWITALVLAATAVLLPLRLVVDALAMRWLGRVPAGTCSRWSPRYVLVWLRTATVDRANEWLSGALFWPWWLRVAGMRVGRRSEISTVIDVLPEQVSVGADCFFADGIYVGGPVVHRGTVTVAPVRFGDRSFVGNHAVIPAGSALAADLLLGVCTVADAATMPSGTSWFGDPPFRLPKREIVTADRRLTHEPSRLRYANRVFWESLRFALPAANVGLSLWWFASVAPVIDPADGIRRAITATAAIALVAVLGIAALKWLLLGRVRPGQHALWSCWCSRWDFLYVAWGRIARAPLSQLDGTVLLQWVLRLFGVSIGRRVVLGDGFTQVVDPDMLRFDDGATVDAQFQAHSFEDRVLKIDRVRIGRDATVCRDAVLLYGADVGDGARVAAHSVVMKHERLTAGLHYIGAPIREHS